MELCCGSLTDALPSSSKDTATRAAEAGIQDTQSDAALVAASDCILSIVPPRDALATARRVAEACRDRAAWKERNDRLGVADSAPAEPLVFADLNAVSPSTARGIAEVVSSRSGSEVPIKFVDGGIIGGPPKPKSGEESKEWTKPSVVMSGPEKLPNELARVLNVKHVSEKIGQASGLKMCFASLSKVSDRHVFMVETISTDADF